MPLCWGNTARTGLASLTIPAREPGLCGACKWRMCSSRPASDGWLSRSSEFKSSALTCRLCSRSSLFQFGRKATRPLLHVLSLGSSCPPLAPWFLRSTRPLPVLLLQGPLPPAQPPQPAPHPGHTCPHRRCTWRPLSRAAGAMAPCSLAGPSLGSGAASAEII